MIAKKDEEMAALREGGKRLGEILRTLADHATPGVSTLVLEDEARRMIAEGGDTAAFLGYKPAGSKRPYPAALCVSINDAIVHGIPNEGSYIIQDGDVVTVDLGLVHKGHITDAAITVIAGTGNPEDVKLVSATRDALAAGIAEARVGNTLGDVGAAIEAVGNRYKLGSPRDLGGHSVGKKVHEEPFIPNFGKRGEGVKIVEGMVLAIEPMLTRGSSEIKLDPDGYTYRTKDGSRAAHSEHTILVTATGPEVLTA